MLSHVYLCDFVPELIKTNKKQLNLIDISSTHINKTKEKYLFKLK